VPYARRFFLPQWVAFDEQDNLVVGALTEAEAEVASMQRFLFVLHAAVSLAPYMVADGRLSAQALRDPRPVWSISRALARFETRGIIENHTAAVRQPATSTGPEPQFCPTSTTRPWRCALATLR